MQAKRPLSISIIGWYTLFTGIVLTYSLLFNLFSSQARSMIESMGQSYTSSLAWTTVSLVVHLAAGIAILKGLNWGRLLYLFYNPTTWVIGWITQGFSFTAILNITIYCVIVFFLIKPETNKFFLPKGYVLNDQDEVEVNYQNEKKMSIGKRFRKVIGGGLASFGIIWVIDSLGVIFFGLIQKQLLALAIGGGLILTGIFLFVLPSIFIWDRKRWRKLLGLTFVVVGVFSLFGLLSIVTLVNSKDWKTMMETSQQLKDSYLAFSDSIKSLVLNGVFSLVLLPAGTLLLRKQSKIDKGLTKS